MKIHPLNSYAVDRLRSDLKSASKGWEWSRGAYGHTLSLPGRMDIHSESRDHYNNLPYADVLGECPYFQFVFDSFAGEKASFRLLRRPPHTCYGWHTDRDKGAGVIRFQIPIVTNPQSWLVVTDFEAFEEIEGFEERLSEAATYETFDRFKQRNPGRFRLYALEPGTLYYFDTRRFHTLVNEGPEERYTLSIDVVANEWLVETYPVVAEELSSAGGLRGPHTETVREHAER
jgi:hypothetical protein